MSSAVRGRLRPALAVLSLSAALALPGCGSDATAEGHSDGAGQDH